MAKPCKGRSSKAALKKIHDFLGQHEWVEVKVKQETYQNGELSQVWGTRCRLCGARGEEEWITWT